VIGASCESCRVYVLCCMFFWKNVVCLGVCVCLWFDGVLSTAYVVVLRICLRGLWFLQLQSTHFSLLSLTL